MDESTQRLVADGISADFEQVFGSRVEVENNKVLINKDNAGREMLKNLSGLRPIQGPPTAAWWT